MANFSLKTIKQILQETTEDSLVQLRKKLANPETEPHKLEDFYHTQKNKLDMHPVDRLQNLKMLIKHENTPAHVVQDIYRNQLDDGTVSSYLLENPHLDINQLLQIIGKHDQYLNNLNAFFRNPAVPLMSLETNMFDAVGKNTNSKNKHAINAGLLRLSKESILPDSIQNHLFDYAINTGHHSILIYLSKAGNLNQNVEDALYKEAHHQLTDDYYKDAALMNNLGGNHNISDETHSKIETTFKDQFDDITKESSELPIGILNNKKTNPGLIQHIIDRHEQQKDKKIYTLQDQNEIHKTTKALNHILNRSDITNEQLNKIYKNTDTNQTLINKILEHPNTTPELLHNYVNKINQTSLRTVGGYNAAHILVRHPKIQTNTLNLLRTKIKNNYDEGSLQNTEAKQLMDLINEHPNAKTQEDL